MGSQAPVLVMTVRIRGKVILRTPAKLFHCQFRTKCVSEHLQVVNENHECHALLSLDSREDLGGVLEGDRTFSERVTDGEEINESGWNQYFCPVCMLWMLTHSTTGPIREPLDPSVLRRDRPAASKKIHIRGKV